MTVRENIEPSQFSPIPHWDKPRDGLFQIITECWWVVDDDGNPLVWTPANSPQCNENRAIAERIAKGRGRQVKQLPVVYMPVKPSDFE